MTQNRSERRIGAALQNHCPVVEQLKSLILLHSSQCCKHDDIQGSDICTWSTVIFTSKVVAGCVLCCRVPSLNVLPFMDLLAPSVNMPAVNTKNSLMRKHSVVGHFATPDPVGYGLCTKKSRTSLCQVFSNGWSTVFNLILPIYLQLMLQVCSKSDKISIVKVYKTHHISSHNCIKSFSYKIKRLDTHVNTICIGWP